MANAFLLADVGRDIAAGTGLATITAYVSPTQVTCEIYQAFSDLQALRDEWTILGTPQATCTPSAATPVGAAITLTLDIAGGRASDVGKYVRINNGLCRIDSYSSPTSVNATIQNELVSPVACPPYAWTLEASIWGGNNGYPRCGCFHQQRLWVGGSPGFPQTIAGSVIGEFFNFLDGVFDDQAMQYILASSKNATIRHMQEAMGLVVFTNSGEFSVRGGAEDTAITPTNISVKSQSGYGANTVSPVLVGDEIFFIQRAGRKARAMAPNQFNTEKYGSPDMSVLAEHITESGIVDMAYQQEPDSLLYLCRADGQLAVLTIDRDQDVVGWSRYRTDGAIESICTVPTATGETLFAVVNRVIQGQQARYIEKLDPALQTDSALVGYNAAGAVTWTGLGHLEGRTVTVKGDGVALADQVVTGGQITIERAAFIVEIGLKYVTTLVTLTPVFQGQAGSTAGANYSIHETIIKLRDSIGLTVNYQEVPFRKFGAGVLDVAPQPFTGDKKAGNLGWAEGVAKTIIQQNLPYPLHVLSVVTKLSVNEG